MPDLIQNSLPLKKIGNPHIAFYGLETTVCYLMTRFMTHPCPRTARTIIHHLHLLTEHPEAQDEAESHKVYGGLLEEWQAIASELLQQRDLPDPGENACKAETAFDRKRSRSGDKKSRAGSTKVMGHHQAGL